MFKKLAVTMFIVVLVLAGCSKPAPQVVVKEVPVTVEVEKAVVVEVEREPIVIEWYSEYAGQMPRYAPIEGVETVGDWGVYVAELYESTHPGVNIVPQVAVYTGGGSEQLSVRLAAGKAPTVYEGFAGRVFTYAPLLMGLPESTAPFLPAAVDALAHTDKILVYPVEFRGSLFVINTTLVEGAGCKVPGIQWTTDEATELAKCLAESGDGYLTAFFTQKQSAHNHAWGWMSGGATMFKDGDYTHCTFSNDYTVAYLEWEKSLLPYLPGNPSQYDVLEWLDQFTIGKHAVGVAGWIPRVDGAYKDGKIDKPQEFKAINWPHLPSVGGNPLVREAARVVGVFESAVQGNERLKAEAIEFATWLTGPVPGFAYHATNEYGSRQDSHNVQIPAAEQEVVDQFGTWGPGFASGGFNEARTIWSEEMYEFWTGSKSAKEALDSFVERYDEILADIW